MGDRTFRLWLAPLTLTSLHQDDLVLDGPPEVATWASQRLNGAIAKAAEDTLGRRVTIHFGDAPLVAREERPATQRSDGDAFNPRLTFEQFVIGPSNRLAHAAALSVAEMPAQAYNPLFIYGPPGLGKTHLLHSVANYVAAFGGGLTVRYATAEQFTNAFLAALASRDLEAFKARFRGIDVLLLDDVQFLERKARTEEELFHTFNALYDAGSQLVITSDRLPADLDGLQDRLCERFAAGLVTDIGRPDLATRTAILRKRAAHDGLDICDSSIDAIAQRVSTNVRALEGTLIRVVAYASLTGATVNGELVDRVLARLGQPTAGGSSLTIVDIQTTACAHFGVSSDDLLSRSRAARVSWARQAAMYLARELTDHSLPQIASAFGGRDHTTVLHACRRVAAHMASTPSAYEDIETLTRKLVRVS